MALSFWFLSNRHCKPKDRTWILQLWSEFVLHYELTLQYVCLAPEKILKLKTPAIFGDPVGLGTSGFAGRGSVCIKRHFSQRHAQVMCICLFNSQCFEAVFGQGGLGWQRLSAESREQKVCRDPLISKDVLGNTKIENWLGNKEYKFLGIY